MKIVQSCVTLCDPMDYTIHGILQVRILSGEQFPSSGDLPNPGVEPRSPALQADSLPAEPPGKPKLGKEYLTAAYCHPAYLTHMQSTSCGMLG